MMLHATTLTRPKADECNVLTKTGVTDNWRVHRTFADDAAAHHWAAGVALARTGRWPIYCVRGKRYALPIILALLMVAPALAQEQDRHHDRAEWSAPIVRPQHSYIDTESAAHWQQRVDDFESRCKPAIVRGVDGIGRYVYAEPNCGVAVMQ